jgi:DNA-binding ferritin-like protein
MNIEYIVSTDSIDTITIFDFCEYLNTVLSNIKMCHLFTDNYNFHKIFDKTYQKLSNIFDSLQEELIEIAFDKNFKINNPYKVSFIENCDYYDCYYQSTQDLILSLSSNLDLNFLSTLNHNGVQNIIDEIMSEINKSYYLLKMAKTSKEPESKNVVVSTQTLKLTDFVPQTS